MQSIKFKVVKICLMIRETNKQRKLKYKKNNNKNNYNFIYRVKLNMKKLI